MKFLHTADWHAGRMLHGTSRTPEIREALQEIAELARTEAVDLVLVAGDVFDTRNPSAEAEQAVFEFFATLARSHIPSVVIAGNHDSAMRLEASRQLFGLVGAHVFGAVRVANEGGVFSLNLGGEEVQVAAMPFVSERRLVKVADMLGKDPGQWRSTYQSVMRKLVSNLAGGFREDSVNLLMMHTTTEGAELSHSEYVFHASETYTVPADIFPANCNYVALGHIHKPQPILGAENRGRYCGSLIQLDFGERGSKKLVNIVEAQVGKPTKILKEYEIRSGKRLRQFKWTREELDRRFEELQGEGWVKLSLQLERPDPGLKDRLMRDHPNLLIVEQQLPQQANPEAGANETQQLSLQESYGRYLRDEVGMAGDGRLQATFAELLREADPMQQEEAALAESIVP